MEDIESCGSGKLVMSLDLVILIENFKFIYDGFYYRQVWGLECGVRKGMLW